MNCKEIVRFVGLELNKLKTRELICQLFRMFDAWGVYVLFLWTEYWVSGYHKIN